jgi:ankyrin repeat protein
MGIGTIDEWRIQFPLSDTEFVVDTLPPQFKEEMFVSTARELVINDNDNVSPPSDFTYPPDWGPHTVHHKAMVNGTLDIQHSLLHKYSLIMELW